MRNVFGKPLEGVLVVSDVDGTVTPEDTIFSLFEKYGAAEEAKALDSIRRSSDVKIILDRISSRTTIREKDLTDVADDAKLFAGCRPFYSRLERLGAKVCLLTTTYEPIAERMALRLGLEKPLVKATKVRMKGGIVLGFEGPLMEGGEKRKAVLEASSGLGFPLSAVVGIGDSQGDAEFMAAIAAGSGLCFWVKRPDFAMIERKMLERYSGGE